MDDPFGLKFEAAIRSLGPVLAAEASRGNTGGRSAGDMHDRRSVYQLRNPVDTEALLAQFDFGPGVTVISAPPGAVSFAGVEGDPIFGIVGRAPAGWVNRRLRARWWRRWNAAPRERLPFADPFAGLSG